MDRRGHLRKILHEADQEEGRRYRRAQQPAQGEHDEARPGHHHGRAARLRGYHVRRQGPEAASAASPDHRTTRHTIWASKRGHAPPSHTHTKIRDAHGRVHPGRRPCDSRYGARGERAITYPDPNAYSASGAACQRATHPRCVAAGRASCSSQNCCLATGAGIRPLAEYCHPYCSTKPLRRSAPANASS